MSETHSVLATDAVLRPVRTGNAFEDTVERLLQAVRLGVFPSGGRLPAGRELAVRLGVSRVTVREALRALEEAGYVEVRRGRFGGTVVTYRPDPARPRERPSRAYTAAELDDALLFREVVEVGAAAAAARTALGPGERGYLRDRAAEVAAAAAPEYRRADNRLHLAIAEVSGSPSLVAAVADVRTRLEDLLDAIPFLERNLVHSTEQHAAVVDAVLAGDEAGARRHMTDHVTGTAALLRGFLG